MSDALNECTVVELRRRLRAGEICARDIVLSVEAAIAALLAARLDVDEARRRLAGGMS